MLPAATVGKNLVGGAIGFFGAPVGCGRTVCAALRRCLDLGDKLGIHAVEVRAIDQAAKAFYEKYGFVPPNDSELHLFLPVATIRDGTKRSSG